MKKAFAALTAAGLLALGFIMVTPVTASAHTPSASLSCSEASVSLVNYDSGATAEVTLDGTVEHSGTFGGHYVESWPLVATQDHTLVVHVVSQDSAQYNFNFNQTTTGCAPVKPPEPSPIVVVTTHTSTDCKTDTDTVYTDTTTTDWSYDAASNTWVKGTPTTVETSTSSPATAQECPTSTPTPTPTPTTPTTHHNVGTPNSGKSLAYTGARINPAELWIAFAAIVGGCGFLFIQAGRRRRKANR